MSAALRIDHEAGFRRSMVPWAFLPPEKANPFRLAVLAHMQNYLVVAAGYFAGTAGDMNEIYAAHSGPGKVIIITGGGRGIGAATALLAAKRGYKVCISYLEQSAAAETVVRSIRDAGGTAIAVQSDVGNDHDVIRLFATVDGELGRVTALVNNAGTLEIQARVEAIDAARLHRIFNTNVVGSFLCAREAVKRMSSRHHGTGGGIVNVSSIAALYGAAGEYVDYAASKGAIDSFTLGLAGEVAEEGIRVNAVRPGVIYTEIHAKGGEPQRVDRVKMLVPMKRGGSPEEVAAAILWLLSDESSYITGSILDVSGGR